MTTEHPGTFSVDWWLLWPMACLRHHELCMPHIVTYHAPTVPTETSAQNMVDRGTSQQALGIIDIVMGGAILPHQTTLHCWCTIHNTCNPYIIVHLLPSQACLHPCHLPQLAAQVCKTTTAHNMHAPMSIAPENSRCDTTKLACAILNNENDVLW